MCVIYCIRPFESKFSCLENLSLIVVLVKHVQLDGAFVLLQEYLVANRSKKLIRNILKLTGTRNYSLFHSYWGQRFFMREKL